MQSLMGDRLLKLFLKRSRRRVLPADSEGVESKAESEGTLTGLPESTSNDSTKRVGQSQSEGGPQGLCGDAQVLDELDTNTEFPAEDADPASSDDLEGGAA